MDVFGWYLGVFLGSPSISPKNAINLQISLLLVVEESSSFNPFYIGSPPGINRDYYGFIREFGPTRKSTFSYNRAFYI